ncbi:hypothetical protein DMUE_2875 [Dictyocoela muelleri]|nr:hypothetical protein DMUE_2875 [Dictyocoela muelleri]
MTIKNSQDSKVNKLKTNYLNTNKLTATYLGAGNLKPDNLKPDNLKTDDFEANYFNKEDSKLNNNLKEPQNDTVNPNDCDFDDTTSDVSSDIFLQSDENDNINLNQNISEGKYIETLKLKENNQNKPSNKDSKESNSTDKVEKLNEKLKNNNHPKIVNVVSKTKNDQLFLFQEFNKNDFQEFKNSDLLNSSQIDFSLKSDFNSHKNNSDALTNDEKTSHQMKIKEKEFGDHEEQLNTDLCSNKSPGYTKDSNKENINDVRKSFDKEIQKNITFLNFNEHEKTINSESKFNEAHIYEIEKKDKVEIKGNNHVNTSIEISLDNSNFQFLTETEKQKRSREKFLKRMIHRQQIIKNKQKKDEACADGNLKSSKNLSSKLKNNFNQKIENTCADDLKLENDQTKIILNDNESSKTENNNEKNFQESKNYTPEISDDRTYSIGPISNDDNLKRPIIDNADQNSMNFENLKTDRTNDTHEKKSINNKKLEKLTKEPSKNKIEDKKGNFGKKIIAACISSKCRGNSISKSHRESEPKNNSVRISKESSDSRNLRAKNKNLPCNKEPFLINKKDNPQKIISRLSSKKNREINLLKNKLKPINDMKCFNSGSYKSKNWSNLSKIMRKLLSTYNLFLDNLNKSDFINDDDLISNPTLKIIITEIKAFAVSAEYIFNNGDEAAVQQKIEKLEVLDKNIKSRLSGFIKEIMIKKDILKFEYNDKCQICSEILNGEAIYCCICDSYQHLKCDGVPDSFTSSMILHSHQKSLNQK